MGIINKSIGFMNDPKKNVKFNLKNNLKNMRNEKLYHKFENNNKIHKMYPKNYQKSD